MESTEHHVCALYVVLKSAETILLPVLGGLFKVLKTRGGFDSGNMYVAETRRRTTSDSRD
jgi:hypothetical protein